MNSRELSEKLMEIGYPITNRRIIEEWRVLENNFVTKREFVFCDLNIDANDAAMLDNISDTLLIMLLFRLGVDIRKFEELL